MYRVRESTVQLQTSSLTWPMIALMYIEGAGWYMEQRTRLLSASMMAIITSTFDLFTEVQVHKRHFLTVPSLTPISASDTTSAPVHSAPADSCHAAHTCTDKES